MKRRATLALVAAALGLAGCTAAQNDSSSTPAPTQATAAESAPSPAPARPREALVTVVDGDTNRRVPTAQVVIGREAGAADERGLARVPLRRPGSLAVEISAPGYVTKRIRLRFGERRRYTIRIYQRALQWPVYGATPARTQHPPAFRMRPPFRAVWARGLGSLVEFPAIVWEGVAYVNTLEGVLYALSMRNGRVLWRQQIGTKVASSPAVDPESRTLLVTTMLPGDFQVRDLATGELLWRLDTGPAEPSPVVREGVAYLAATSGAVTAVDLERRAVRWTYATGAKVTSSPALAGNRLYVGTYAGTVLCLEARDGRHVWTAAAGSRVYGTVAVAGGRVFAPDVSAGLTAFDASTGERLWRVPAGGYAYASPAVYRDRVFFGDYAGTVRAVDARTGTVLWTASAGGAISGALEVIAGVVYAGSFADRITGWDWQSGREVFRFPHGQYVPVSGSGGRLLLHGFSKIYAVESERP